MSQEYSIEKFTDLAVSGLAPGGKLQDDQSDTFYVKVFDKPGLVQDVRRVQMKSDTMNINKIALGSDIVRPGPTGTPPYIVDGVGETFAANRVLASADRFSPTFEQVVLTSKEYMAEIFITDDIMENNLEQEDIVGIVSDLAAARIRLEMEKHFIIGDTANGALDPAYRLQNGVLKRTTTNVVDHAGADVNLDLFANLQLALPTRYAQNMGSMKFYLHNYKEIAWRQVLAARGTSLGDQTTVGAPSLGAMGVPLATAATMPLDQVLYADPKNLIIGFQREVRLETERRARDRGTFFIWTYKAAFQIEEEPALVKAINLG
jgi:HK97 family phage major capsid protein